ncbi:MAG: nuclear transport factor 2 family protein [Tomitella sp.]|nr:nuclear transport factor 2 family protein [Tomitella sp.]
MEDNHISDQRARSFAAGLRRFEQDSDPAPFVALFAPDAVTERLDARGERQGEVERFWREYRDQFGEIRTTFFNVVEGEDQFALEWTSTGTLHDGRPIDYRGVTVIDLEGDLITRLRTYYDSAAFMLVPASTT